jgi:hypothetical protein
MKLCMIPMPQVIWAEEDSTIADDKLSEARVVALQKKMDVIYYQSQSDTFSKRVELFEGNMMKAYALIYGAYCSRDMQGKVDDAVAIDGTINNNPIKLLDETIRSLMHERTSTSYCTAMYVTTNLDMFSIMQRDTESMAEYYKRFKETRDIFRQTHGQHCMDDWIQREVPGSDKATEQLVLKLAAQDQMMACIY